MNNVIKRAVCLVTCFAMAVTFAYADQAATTNKTANTNKAAKQPQQKSGDKQTITGVKVIKASGSKADFTAVTQPRKDTEYGSIHLQIGKGKLFYYKGKPKTIFIADPSIASFHLKTPGIIYITPKKIGETNLIAVDSERHVLFEKKIIVGINTTKVFDLIKKIAPKSNIRIQTVDNNLVLRGSVPHASQVSQIMQILSGYLKNVKILNFLKVSSPPQVYLRVRVVEMSRNVSRVLGLNWGLSYRSGNFNFATGFIGTGGNGGGSGGNITGGIGLGIGSGGSDGFNFAAFLDALENNGLATVLAEPNLSTLSGTTAKFLAGGEFPIPVSQALGATTIQFRTFGVGLNFTPTILDKDLINLKINVNVSSLSSNGAVNLNGFSVPGLTTRNADVNVELHSGQSFAIAGLLQKNINKLVKKFPGLGDLPILGLLFRSEQFEKNQTELVIVVTPYLVRPSSKKLSDPLQGLPNEANTLQTESPHQQATHKEHKYGLIMQ